MKKFQFGMRDTIALAQFIAELQRQCIEYSVRELAGGWEITIVERG